MVASQWFRQIPGGPPVEEFFLLLEDDSGDILLESGDFILLEGAP